MAHRPLILSVALLFPILGLNCAPVQEPPRKDGAVQVKKDNDPSPPTVPVPKHLQARVEAALKHVADRPLLTTHSFWTIFHGILGNGFSIPLTNPVNMEKVNAIDYIARGGELRGLQFLPTEYGLDVRIGPLFEGQGHQDQFVAEMIQWGMPLDRTIKVNNKDYPFEAFVRHSKMFARTTKNQELSWAVLIMGQCYGTDHSWTNGAGEKLHVEDVVRYELDQPIETAACGGTHRLFGLTWVYHLYRNKGGKKEGVWKDCADKIQHYVKRAKEDQSKADGSFSTDYFKSKAHAPETDLRIGTTGHILEWLALALPDEELQAPWVQDAVNALALMILESQQAPVDGGSLYHATHGLHIYHTRVFGPPGSAGPLPLPPRD